MTRSLFGSWGADTSDEVFAAALAIIGVATAVAAERLAGPQSELGTWWNDYNESPPRDEPLPWNSPLQRPDWDAVDASEWAALWTDHPAWSSRYAVDPDLGALDERWLTDVLRDKPVWASGVYFRREASTKAMSLWRFPLRIGLIDAAGGVEIGRAIEEASENTHWVKTLIAPIHLGPEAVSADIILAVGALEEIDRAVSDLREHRADAVIAFSPECTLRVLERLRASFEVPVVAAVDHPHPADWLIDFTRELSHDAPFDVALDRASRGGGIVEGPTSFMVGQQASRRASAIADTLRAIGSTGKRSAGAMEAAALAADFEDAAGATFTSESGDASALVEMERRASPLVAEVSGARWLQAQIADRTEPDRPLDQFHAGTDHEIRIRIAPPDAEWLEGAAAFPEDQLPVGAPNRLTIVLTEPTLLKRPLVEELVLPAIGASEPCVFTLTTRADTTEVDARIIVLSRNRVLQTARLPEQVAVTGGTGRRSLETASKQVAAPETIVRGAGGNLAERRTFDAAFVVNHGRDGVARATAVSGGQAAVIDLDDVSIVEAVDKVRRRLGEIVDQPEDFAGLEQKGTRELFVFLAHHGALLRRALVKDFLGETLAGATHLQVVSARPDAFFPFELAYDFIAPGEDAVMCPDAATALGDDDVTAGCPGTHDQATVCPLGFWAISKVIERHAFQPGNDVPKGFLIRSQPTRDRNSIALRSQALLAVSDRVDNFAAGSRQSLADAVGVASGSVEQPLTWGEWQAAVADGSSSLLMVLPHTVHSDTLDTFGLEIGTRERAWAGDIDERFVPPENPVIVVLLGCETAVGDVGYERFPGIFRRAGAEVVIGTLTEVLGRHAAPVGERLAQSLYECCDDGARSIGEVMVRLRRRLLVEGVTMVLALAVFGDADWVLERGR